MDISSSAQQPQKSGSGTVQPLGLLEPKEGLQDQVDAYLQGWKLRPNRDGRNSAPQPLYTGTLQPQGLGPGNMQIRGPLRLDAYLQRWKPRAQ